MRVGLVMEQTLAPVPGGTGRYSKELAAALAVTGRAEVSGWTAWHRSPAAGRVRGVRGPLRLPLGHRALTLSWERGLGPRPHGVDLIHAPTPLAPRRGRTPLVATVHDAVPWTHPDTLTPRGVAWHRAMIDRIARTADAVIVPSTATARALAVHVHLRAEPAVIPLGVTPMTVPADAADRRTRLGVPDGPYVFSLATLEPRKGLDVLIGALALPAAPDLPLVVAGDPGWGGQDLPSIARAVGLDPGRIHLLGRIGGPDLAALFDGAAVLAVPSRAEGFGLPVLEGMGAGVPVVVSDDPALLEIGGDCVVVAARGNAPALAAALTVAVADTARLVAAGLSRSAAYTWAATAEATLAVYDAVLG